MSLKINSLAERILKISAYLGLAFLVGCIIKVFIWELIYYSDKEGSQRTVTPVVYDEQEVSEEEVTEQQISEHIVAPDQPRYLTIEKIGVHNARIFRVGLTRDGKMDVPANIFDVGWYNESGKPGSGGTLLMDGHNGGPTREGVFKKLDRLAAGDKIVVERGDGTRFTYGVVENKTMRVDEANAYMNTMQQSPIPGEESISLITCTGEWTSVQRTYLSRAMVRAVLVEN